MWFWPLFLEYPALALVPACAFLVAWIVRLRVPAPLLVRVLRAVGAPAWVAYFLYETRMKIWSESVIAPIRVDLIVAVPVLLVISGAAMAALAWPPSPTSTNSRRG